MVLYFFSVDGGKIMERHKSFKCRCLNYLHQRITGVGLMSGEFHYHTSLVSHIYPYGLHPVSYRFVGEDFVNSESDDDWVMVKRRMYGKY